MKESSRVHQYFNLWVLLSQTRDAIFRARQKELNRYNISIVEASVLFAIQAIGDQATPAEIARWIFRKPQSVTELLNRMEKKGLLTKVKDLDRKNQVRIRLTDKGREIYYHQSAEPASICEIMSSLSDEDCQRLGSCLWTLRGEALKELGIEHRMRFPL
jgi:DNA-binding MarR family transcriptional regulator